MTDLVDKDLHRSIEPAIRLVISGVFALLGIALAIFQVAGEATPWLKPNPGLWYVAVGSFTLACIVFLVPVRSRAVAALAETELRPAESEASAKEYVVSEAIAFYDRIADVYDARLTREYLDTLRESADRLLSAFPDGGRRLRVLDVGAGTGQFVRLLEGAKRIHWTCIEPASGMAHVLRRFFEGPPVSPEIVGIGLEDAPRYLKEKTFDAISLNFVLSSLESLPDFASFYDLLAPDGVLVVSDGHPAIRSATSSFRMRCMDGIHALNIIHRPSSEVAHTITRGGLFVQSESESTVTKKGRLYSYVLCFRKVNSQRYALMSSRSARTR